MPCQYLQNFVVQASKPQIARELRMSSPPKARLVAVPALISLGVTLLRLIGERRHWSPAWFSPATGGIVPSGMSWLVGITWLAVPFGAWFAWRLLAAGDGPPSAAHALGHAVLGIALVLGGLRLAGRLPLPFPPILVVIWAVMALGALLQWPTWPGLFKTLLVYGLTARVPVAVIMFLAMRGEWGTHYDYVGMPAPFQLPFWPRFLWLALFPQLVFWVGFTILAGSFAGSLVALAARRRAAVAPARA
jgi:hypothetical protein